MLNDLYLAVGGALAALVAFAGLLWKAYSGGRDREIARKAEKDAQMRFEFDKIDSQRPNLDDSLGRLRKRSGSDGSASPK